MIRPATRRQQGIGVAAVVVALALVGGSLGVLESERPAATSAPPSEPPPATGGERMPLAIDGSISDDDLYHDSRDDLYRAPSGALPAGTEVALRLRAAAGDLSEATVRLWDAREQRQQLLPMTVVATDPTGGDHGFAYWEATLPAMSEPGLVWYRFIVRDGPAVRYLEDDRAADGGAVPEGNDGGPGVVYRESPDSSWQITVYDPGFTTPAWTRGAVVYQVFPDRFFNGDPSNDPSPDAAPGGGPVDRFRGGDVYGNTVLPRTWDERPEGACRAYEGAACDEEPLGRDFFGGDLAGLTEKLPELDALGVTAIYLNPVFAAPSNHRYDTSSFDVIDPDLGTVRDLDRLLSEAESRGMRVILDGVFNHVSADSPWFDRYARFEEVGACEAAGSPYRTWFTFRQPAVNEPSPCVPGADGGTDTYYQGWFGFDTLPELVERPEVVELLTGPDGVTRRWVRQGASGFRLDVMDSLSNDLVRRIRRAVKTTDPDALVLGEQWEDASAWLLGDQADGATNYRFRRAVIGLINGDTEDPDGAIVGLSPSQFAARMEGLMEDYPRSAFDALLNLVDSHDTARILWTLTPGRDDPAVKESASNLATGKTKLRQLAMLQLTWPGMASIYYGTEAGITGHDDPDNRRPYPWDDVDGDLRAWYRTLGALRAEHVALREGDLRFLHADDQVGTLAYLRRTNREAAIIVLNLSARPQVVEIDVAGFLPEDAALFDGLGGPGATVEGGSVTVEVAEQAGAVLLTAPGTDLAPPAAPAGLEAVASAGSVELTWSPPGGEAPAWYQVWRSIVHGGGYELVGTASVGAFVDSDVRNGTRYHYVVVAIDGSGNPGPRSGESQAQPMLAIADARLEDVADVRQALSAVDEGTPIGARVFVPGVTQAPGPTTGVLAELGFGSARADPGTTYTWSPMHFDADVGGADRLVGTVRPEEIGTYTVVLRVSVDGGGSWLYADRGGIVRQAWGYRPSFAVTLTTTAAADRGAPPAPAAPRVVAASAVSLTLAWDPVTAADVDRYEVLRRPVAGGEYEVAGAAIEPRFTDDEVEPGASYTYVVVAVDTSFNRSGPSGEVVAAAEEREVAVRFTVTVPPTTPPEERVYLVGDFQGWNPAGTPMERIDGSTWAVTIPFEEGAAVEYAYTRGSWDDLERGVACGERANRMLTVTHGEGGALPVTDAVDGWHDIDGCS